MTKQTRLLTFKFLALTMTLFVAAVSSAKTGVAKAGVNFRASPNGKIITGVPRGDNFEVLGESGSWTKVKLASGHVGYIYSKYVSTSYPDVSDTEGGYCAECAMGSKKAEQAQAVLDIVNPVSGVSACITSKIVTAARWIHRNKYGGRTRGGGNCQYAIRFSLQRAGVWPGGSYGHAKDTVPTMLKMGFKNLYKPGMTPQNAPAGSILVYGSKLKGARCKSSMGNTYGHIELKENKNSYLYDGNPKYNIQESYGAKCRPLKGVMVMGNSCPTCSKALKKSCGA